MPPSICVTQGAPAPVTKGWPVIPGILPATNWIITSKNKINDAIVVPTFGCATVLVTVESIGTISGLIGQYEMSDNGAAWSCPQTQLVSQNSNTVFSVLYNGPYSINTGPITLSFLIYANGANFVRFRITAVQTGTGTVRFNFQPFNNVSTIAANIATCGITLGVNTLNIANAAISVITQAVQASQTSGVAAATTARTTTTGWAIYKSVDFVLNVTAGGTATGTVNIYIQDSVDGGTTWDDVVSFAQLTLGGGTQTQRACVQGAIATSRAGTAAQQTQALAANSIRQGPFGDRFKVVEVVAGPSGSPVGATYRIDAIGHL